MDDDYEGQDSSIIAASRNWVEITPHDTDKVTHFFKSIAVGGTGGPVVMKGTDGTAATFYFNPGDIKPLSPSVVLATGTTATPIYGLK